MNNLYTPDNLRAPDTHSEPLESDGVIVISPVRRVMSANSQAEKILMMPINPGQAFNITNRITGNHLSNFERSLDSTLVHGLSHENLETILSLGSGNFTTLIFSINPIFDHSEIIGAILAFRPRTSNSIAPEPEDENIIFNLTIHRSLPRTP